MNTKGYSIWLESEGEIKQKLLQLIKKLVKKYNTSNFYPHVTLLGGIEGDELDIVSKTHTLANRLNPYVLTVDNFGMEDFYFSSLYLRIQKTAPVQNANQLARDIFDMQSPEEYLPHLSLMYSNLSTEKKQKIISELNLNSFPNFTVRSLSLYRTEGKVEDWKKIAEVSLKS